jgi:hypothetical protein
LTGGRKQSAVQISELAFPVIVGAGEARYVIAVKQTGFIAVSCFLDDMKEKPQVRIGLALCMNLVEIIPEGLFLHPGDFPSPGG